MKVKQKCFMSINDFSDNPEYRKGNGEGGVYLWGFSLEEKDFSIPSSPDKFFPYYVGKIYKDLYGRTAEHIASLAGGNYSVFKIKECVNNQIQIGEIIKKYKSSIKASSVYSGTSLPDPLFPGLIHFPQGAHLSKKYFTDKIIQNELDWMIKHFCITYFIPTKQNKGDIDNLEKKIGNIIGYEKLITKPYKDPSDFIVEIENTPASITINKYEDLFTSCRGVMTGVKLGII